MGTQKPPTSRWVDVYEGDGSESLPRGCQGSVAVRAEPSTSARRRPREPSRPRAQRRVVAFLAGIPLGPLCCDLVSEPASHGT